MSDLRRRLLLVFFLAIAACPPAWSGAYEDILAAAYRNDTATVADFIRRGMDVNTSDRAGTTLLMIAAGNGNEQLIDFLLKSRANILKMNKYGDSAITIAALRGHLAVLKRLTEGDNAFLDVPGWNALHYSAFGGHADSIRYLISRKASIDARAPNGQTALMLAARNGHLEVVRLLVDARANPNLPDRDGMSALEIASKAGHSEIAELLKRANSGN